MTFLNFKTQVLQYENWTILKLPLNISKELPSRGMVMIEGTINNVDFTSPLEPDGLGSHWLNISDKFRDVLAIEVGTLATLSIRPTKDWIEPELPEDLGLSLKSMQLENQWRSLTTKARWEWIRLIRSTRNPKTRQKRIEITCSKLLSGKKRPCCYNHSKCTEPDLSKNGILINLVANK